jgi:hypothetical protein
MASLTTTQIIPLEFDEEGVTRVGHTRVTLGAIMGAFNDIVRGLLRRQPDIDIVRVQDVGLSGASDPVVLFWTAKEGRILLTHDVTTITHHAYR